MCKGDETTVPGGVSVSLLLEKGTLEQYLIDRPDSVRRIKAEMMETKMLNGPGGHAAIGGEDQSSTEVGEDGLKMSTSMTGNAVQSSGGVPALSLLEQGPVALEQYLVEHPQSSRRVQGEMMGVSLLSGGHKVKSERIPAMQLLERGEMSSYIDDNPQSSRRIQDEMKGVSLLAPGKKMCGGVPAKLLLDQGDLSRYMDSNPQSSRRIQGELSNVSLLGRGKRAVRTPLSSVEEQEEYIQNAENSTGNSDDKRGIPAQLLLQQGELQKYTEENPTSARRIEEEMMSVSLLAGDQDVQGGIATPEQTKMPTQLLLQQGDMGRYLEDNPMSARRIQSDMQEISLLSGQPKPCVKLLLEQGKLESYMNDHPLSVRRIQDEMNDVSLFQAPYSETIPPNKPTVALLLDDGNLKTYLDDNPQSSRRIQGEMRPVPLLSGGQERPRPAAKLLLDQGDLAKYMDSNPQSTRRIQGELSNVSLLANGKEKPVKPTAKLLLKDGDIERYMTDHPMSSRRIVNEMQHISLLGGPAARDEEEEDGDELPDELGDLERDLGIGM